MKRALLYARVSSERQAERDLSIPSQLREMRKFCQEQGRASSAKLLTKPSRADFVIVQASRMPSDTLERANTIY